MTEACRRPGTDAGENDEGLVLDPLAALPLTTKLGIRRCSRSGPLRNASLGSAGPVVASDAADPAFQLAGVLLQGRDASEAGTVADV